MTTMIVFRMVMGSLLAALLTPWMLMGCGGDLSCGNGTAEQDGVCVAVSGDTNDDGDTTDTSVDGDTQPADTHETLADATLFIDDPEDMWTQPDLVRCFQIGILSADGAIRQLPPDTAGVSFVFDDPTVTDVVRDTTCTRGDGQPGFGMVGLNVGSTGFTVTVAETEATAQGVMIVKAGSVLLDGDTRPLKLFANHQSMAALGSAYGLPTLGARMKMTDADGQPHFPRLRLVDSWLDFELSGADAAAEGVDGLDMAYIFTAGAASTGSLTIRYGRPGASARSFTRPLQVVADDPLADDSEKVYSAFWVQADGNFQYVASKGVLHYEADHTLVSHYFPPIAKVSPGACIALGLFVGVEAPAHSAFLPAYFAAPTVTPTFNAGGPPTQADGAFCQSEPSGVTYEVCQGQTCVSVDVSTILDEDVSTLKVTADQTSLPVAISTWFVTDVCFDYEAVLTTVDDASFDVSRFMFWGFEVPQSQGKQVSVIAFDRRTGCASIDREALLGGGSTELELHGSIHGFGQVGGYSLLLTFGAEIDTTW
ncbi:MAG: hypothetical protein ACI9MR_003793 [Myxococcota bacterium]|jgi:hypothetical protein